MKITVYFDMLILTNLLINYFLLRITAVVGGFGYNRNRFILSSLVGAFFSVTVFLEIKYFFLSRLIKLISLSICTFSAFEFKNLRYFIRCLVYFISTNFLAGGVIFGFFKNSPSVYINNMFFYININPIVMVSCILAVYIIITLSDFFLADRAKGEKYCFEITVDNHTFSADGFYDTGFQIKDIIGGKAILLCSDTVLENGPYGVKNAVRNFFDDEDITDKTITPIFYSDISGSGMLPAIKPQQVICINRKGKKIKLDNILLAFKSGEISKDVKIIFGKSIFNMTGD